MADTAHFGTGTRVAASRADALPETRRPPMRTTFLNVGIIAVLVLTFWFGSHTVAKQTLGASIDPFWMTTNATDLPVGPQYDLY